MLLRETDEIFEIKGGKDISNLVVISRGMISQLQMFYIIVNNFKKQSRSVVQFWREDKINCSVIIIIIIIIA